MDMFITLVVVMVSWVYEYLGVCVYQLWLSKAVKMFCLPQRKDVNNK